MIRMLIEDVVVLVGCSLAAAGFCVLFVFKRSAT